MECSRELLPTRRPAGRNRGRTARTIEKAESDPTLHPGDNAYARGLLAATPAAAVAEFRDALAADPTHMAARRSLSLILLCAGQLSEAIRTAEDGHLLYPEHPDFLWVLFVGHGLSGNESAAHLRLSGSTHGREEIHVALNEVVWAPPLMARQFRWQIPMAIRCRSRISSEWPGCHSPFRN